MTVFGSILGPWNVEQAILATLREWVPSYLAEIERQNGLQRGFLGRLTAPESFKGGMDWLSVKRDVMPAVVVNAEPQGEPVRQSSAVIQEYLVQVGAVVASEEGPEPEAATRQRAGLISAATMLLEQHAVTLAGLEETRITGTPKLEWLDPEIRDLMVAVTSWHTWVQVLDPNAGPVAVKIVEPEEPYPEPVEVKTQLETVKAEPVSEPVH